MEPTADREWRTYAEPLLQLGQRTAAFVADPQSLQSRREMYRYLFSQIAAGFLGRAHADAEHPDFWPYVNGAFNMLGPNPDYIYYLTPVDGAGIYRITGFRGTVRAVDFQVGGGTLLPRGTGTLGPSYADYPIDSLRIGADGAFDVVLSAERPAGHAGDWWKLEPAATYVMVRQIACDWIHEVDARIAIERVDRPAVKPRVSAERIDADLRGIAEWAESYTALTHRWLSALRAKDLVNRVTVRDIADVGGVSTQQYIEGLFELAPGEALIVETEVPVRARYWCLQLTDMLWGAIDYVNRQSSLNDSTARLDADGKFRAVICAEDPGVPNWLDTAGHRQGEILGRWYECSSAPQPSVTRVPFADVRQHLPADTPVVTPEQRDAAIRLRRRGAQLRRRW